MVKTPQSMYILKQSEAAATECNRIINMDEIDFVFEYCALPLLPTNQEITIKKIGVYNYHPMLKRTNTAFKYSMFSNESGHDFPIGKNPKYDYMPNDYVTPVIIIDNNNNTYRTNYHFWKILADIFSRIVNKQYITGRKVLPFTVFIDEGLTNQWLAKLYNITLLNK